MVSTLVLDLGDAELGGALDVLAGSGARRLPDGGCDNLVRFVEAEAPEEVLCIANGLSAGLALALSAWNGDPPCPVWLLSPVPPADAAQAAQAASLGVHHWHTLARADADAAAIRSALESGRALAAARWRHERALRLALARSASQLEERKWVDRAKGLLMTTRGLGEDDAFRLLRGAAMEAHLRVGELSRALFESAQGAHAINRAGQLRMLSQRFVRLAAQRLLGIAPREAGSLQQTSARRVRESLAVLARHCAGSPAQPLHEEVERCWEHLDAELGRRLAPATLARIDARAKALLDAADRLTQALEAAAGRRALNIINLCGRQRMRVQRLAKAHLLAALNVPAMASQAPAPNDDAASLLEEFETAQRELEQAPLSSPAIRATLTGVREDWARLVCGLRAQDATRSAQAAVAESETLLARLERLTEAYEHSLQVILG